MPTFSFSSSTTMSGSGVGSRCCRAPCMPRRLHQAEFSRTSAMQHHRSAVWRSCYALYELAQYRRQLAGVHLASRLCRRQAQAGVLIRGLWVSWLWGLLLGCSALLRPCLCTALTCFASCLRCRLDCLGGLWFGSSPLGRRLLDRSLPRRLLHWPLIWHIVPGCVTSSLTHHVMVLSICSNVILWPPSLLSCLLSICRAWKIFSGQMLLTQQPSVKT